MSKASRRTDAEEAKRQRRLERKQQQAVARRRVVLRKRFRNIGITVVIVVAVTVGVYLAFRPGPEVEGVIKPPNRGRDHIDNATYDTPTPTSGAHNPSAPSCGPASQGLSLDLAVHALEHGAVVVWHRPDIDENVRSRALEILREWDSHWILSPNPGIEEPFVATAWNRLKPFEEPDEGLREFVDVYRKRGPERVDCPA